MNEQKFVSKHATRRERMSLPVEELTIEQLVLMVARNPFLDRQLDSIVTILGHMASVMQSGEKVRLAVLLHHVPVVAPVVDYGLCLVCSSKIGMTPWGPDCITCHNNS